MSASAHKNDLVLLFRELSGTDDQQILWHLHKLYFQRLYVYIRSIVGSVEASEEITDDVFVDIWQRRKLLDKVNMPEVYLFVCAKNKAFRYLKNNRHSHESLDDIADIDCVLEKDPYDLLVSSEMLQQINAAIAALPPRCRIIFRLIKENDLKYREVAELLNLSQKTVENQMAIALKKLTSAIVVKKI